MRFAAPLASAAMVPATTWSLWVNLAYLPWDSLGFEQVGSIALSVLRALASPLLVPIAVLLLAERNHRSHGHVAVFAIGMASALGAISLIRLDLGYLGASATCLIASAVDELKGTTSAVAGAD